MKKKFSKIFYENHPPTRHIQYKESNSLLVANQLQIGFFQPIWNDF